MSVCAHFFEFVALGPELGPWFALAAVVRESPPRYRAIPILNRVPPLLSTFMLPFVHLQRSFGQGSAHPLFLPQASSTVNPSGPKRKTLSLNPNPRVQYFHIDRFSAYPSGKGYLATWLVVLNGVGTKLFTTFSKDGRIGQLLFRLHQAKRLNPNSSDGQANLETVPIALPKPWRTPQAGRQAGRRQAGRQAEGQIFPESTREPWVKGVNSTRLRYFTVIAGW